MSRERAALAGRVVSWAGVALIWGVIALVLERAAVDWLRAAGGSGGLFYVGSAWLRPTTVAAAMLFAAVAFYFFRTCIRTGLSIPLVSWGMGAATTAFWVWAFLYARDLAITQPGMGWADWARYSAPVGVSSTAGAVAGLLLGIAIWRRSAVREELAGVEQAHRAERGELQ